MSETPQIENLTKAARSAPGPALFKNEVSVTATTTAGADNPAIRSNRAPRAGLFAGERLEPASAKAANLSGESAGNSDGSNDQREDGRLGERQRSAHPQPATACKSPDPKLAAASTAEITQHASIELSRPLAVSAVAAASLGGAEQATEKPGDPVAALTETPMVPAPVRPTVVSPLTDVSVTVPVSKPGNPSDDLVAIWMVQKGAEIHVSVRTPDSQLTQSMRQELGKLSASLDQAGLRAEAWRPTAAGVATQANTDPQREHSQGGASQNWNEPDQRSGGQSGRGARDQRQKQGDDRPRWVAELERQAKQ